MSAPYSFVFLGLSVTSSWGNGHATTYRALIRELTRMGNDVLFLERDRPWYAANRDLPHPPYGRTELYEDLADLRERFAEQVAGADVVVVGSYVPEGVAVGQWVLDTARGITAFYDIDTPVTLAKLARGDYEYLRPELIPRYDLYLSFSGGVVLEILESRYGAPRARPLYCSVDAEVYRPGEEEARWDLGYLGTYSPDRQPTLEELLVRPARRLPNHRFVVAGPQYPEALEWPANVVRIDHLPPAEHRDFYNRQRFTLNVTRADMIRAGHSPSVRIFEAAACGTPIISDYWEGLETFLQPGREILIARTQEEAIRYLSEVEEPERREIARRARKRVLGAHTAYHRANELVAYVEEVRQGGSGSARPQTVRMGVR